MVIKYVIHPGYIFSRNDGEKHFVSGKQLIRLYKVHPTECIMYRYNPVVLQKLEELSEKVEHLYPRNDGKYSLHKFKEADNG